MAGAARAAACASTAPNLGSCGGAWIAVAEEPLRTPNSDALANEYSVALSPCFPSAQRSRCRSRNRSDNGRPRFAFSRVAGARRGWRQSSS
jgi:hypothetical protein